MSGQDDKPAQLTRYLTPLGAWALAFGSSVGWGAFVMPGTTFLPIAGPWGTVIGIAIGAVIMLVIGLNYHYLINCSPDAGGAFSYVKKTFGYDHGFLCAWFLALTYIAILWANATALPLIARNLLGGLFQVGFSYEIAGFHVYLGEVALAIAMIIICGLFCVRGKLASTVQIIMALALVAGIVVCLYALFSNDADSMAALGRDMATNPPTAIGIVGIVALTPWAFVGFESISHSAGEFTFSPKKAFLIMAIAVVTAGVGYSLLAIIAASVQPSGFSTWQDYIANLGSLSGIEALPTFFATHSVLGDTGFLLLGITTLGAIVTGLIGNYVAASRLLFAMAQDKLLPSWFADLNQRGVPANSILFITAISVVIPFMGRTAISWIVDVTTVGATIAYAYTSACAFKTARTHGEQRVAAVGLVGIIVSLLFMVYFLVPNLMSVSTLSTESYFILAAWSILGFAFSGSSTRKIRSAGWGIPSSCG